MESSQLEKAKVCCETRDASDHNTQCSPVCSPPTPNSASVSRTAAPWVGVTASPHLPVTWTKIPLGQNWLRGRKSRIGESKGLFKNL